MYAEAISAEYGTAMVKEPSADRNPENLRSCPNDLLNGNSAAHRFAANKHMRTLLTVLGLCTISLVSAQITIGPNDMPSAGDTMRYRTTVAGSVDLLTTGANSVWDFSQLSLGLAGADTAVPVNSTPFAYQFFFNNSILYPQHSANFALKGVEFGFQGVSFDDVYDYYKRDASGYRNVGFGANLNGLPTSIRRVPVDWIHRFPMDFGDQDTSFSSFNVSVPTLGYYKQDQTRYNTVDGWGELILPGNTFEVLRVRSVLQQRDSIHIDQLGFGFGANRPQTVEYRWIAQGMDAPVLTVTTVAGVATTARFYYQPITTGIEESAEVSIALWPTPADQELHVELAAGLGGSATILDAAGREMEQVGSFAPGIMRTVSVQHLPTGLYILRIDGGTSVSTQRFSIQR